MPSNHLILCHPLLLLPSIFPSIRVISKESVLHIKWPKYQSFSFSINPSNEYSGLISFRMDWLDLLAVQGALKSLLQYQNINSLVLSFLYGPTLTSIHGSSAGKESTCNAGDASSIPGLGRITGEGIGYPLHYPWASLVAKLVKNLPAMWETWVHSLGWEDTLEKRMFTHSSILAYRYNYTNK